MISVWKMPINFASSIDSFCKNIVAFTGAKVTIKPTVFPDSTTQVWKLPEDLFDHDRNDVYVIDWRFEAEREIFDLSNLVLLLWERAELYAPTIHLYVPYFPFARQDKEVSNTTTFALTSFMAMLNTIRVNTLITVDAHNPVAIKSRIKNIKYFNVPATEMHRELMAKIQPDLIVFPDHGAEQRYETLIPIRQISCEKKRNQETGEILGHTLARGFSVVGTNYLKPGYKVLILDDLCDGGATFISVAKALRDVEKDITIHLFTTHGIYSKGREHLLKNGIDYLYSTNSYGEGEFRV